MYTHILDDAFSMATTEDQIWDAAWTKNQPSQHAPALLAPSSEETTLCLNEPRTGPCGPSQPSGNVQIYGATHASALTWQKIGALGCTGLTYWLTVSNTCFCPHMTERAALACINLLTPWRSDLSAIGPIYWLHGLIIVHSSIDSHGSQKQCRGPVYCVLIYWLSWRTVEGVLLSIDLLTSV